MRAMLLLLLAQNPLLHKDPELHQVRFPAKIYPSHFNRGEGLADHHLIVWKEGRAADLALIQAEVPDREILEALIAVGGTPGDNLGADAWLLRNNPLSTAPDQAVKGSRIELRIRLGARELKVEELLEDHGNKGYLFRLGGHAALIPLWRSGCVVCLESCPGGRVSNSCYTMRDLAAGRARFKLRSGLPPDGTAVEVLMTVVKEPLTSR